ncbi:MAG: type II toxin-antitoxin system VapC family toxin [Paludibacterium sp.]|uniref:type II toxin-antitoxin system VapC family toxin n=1 Tax=Paludibacterium sp. TaxID=1917523 RepID=UPI0025D15D6B|nr:type II toxin-antitoxin system VapC family toxin [Paludibacterium sp.]MBV8048735.1 type II toxin-antitoxin system VapC family toxin [Paludibacterium sp.]MBV8648984.1 type II toxin-antitoxin system VapC family toxin [Paludibacterium sp.]
MNGLLMDTHVLVWLLNGEDRLSAKTIESITHAAEHDMLYVSAISVWEIAMLVSKGRLSLDRDVGEWIQQALSQPGIHLASLTPDISVASTRLPWECHPDPADRIIVATARHLGVTLVTEDLLLLGYATHGHFQARQASR